jgi:hypothetical protein
MQILILILLFILIDSSLYSLLLNHSFLLYDFNFKLIFVVNVLVVTSVYHSALHKFKIYLMMIFQNFVIFILSSTHFINSLKEF